MTAKHGLFPPLPSFSTSGVRVVEVELAGSKGVHDRVEDSELSGGQGADHDATGGETDGAEPEETNLAGNVGEPCHHRPVTTGSLLVHLREQGIGGVRDDGGRHPGNDAAPQRDPEVGAGRHLVGGFAHRRVRGVGNRSLHHELGDGVGDLLAQNGDKSSVKAGDAFGLGHLGKTVGEAGAPRGVAHGADADGFERAQEDVGDELSPGRRPDVDDRLVLPRLDLAHVLGGVHLKELDTAKLKPACRLRPKEGKKDCCPRMTEFWREVSRPMQQSIRFPCAPQSDGRNSPNSLDDGQRTLDEVAGRCCAQSRGKGHGAFLGDDLPEASNETAVVLCGGGAAATSQTT